MKTSKTRGTEESLSFDSLGVGASNVSSLSPVVGRNGGGGCCCCCCCCCGSGAGSLNKKQDIFKK